MPITPIDIKKKKFSSQLRGLNPQEVKNFLDVIATEMEALRKERSLLAEKIDELSAKLEGYQKTEKLLKDTLVTAQQTTLDLKQVAQKEADAIIERSKIEAHSLSQKAEDEIQRLRAEINELILKKSTFINETRGIIQSYLSILDNWAAKTDSEMEKREGEDRKKR